MQIIRISLDGTTHSAPVDVSGTNQEMINATIEASQEDRGCHAVLAEFFSPSNTPTVYHVFASSGVLVVSNLARIQFGDLAGQEQK